MKTFERYKYDILGIVLLLAAVFIAYSNVYNFEFLYDDEFFIVKNNHINSFDSLSDIFTSNSTAGSGFKDSFYRPVQFFLYLVVKTTLGGDPWGFHLLNLLIHFLNAAMLFLLAQKAGFSRRFAVVVALFWCLHPIHVECVAYMSATADSLHTLFLMVGLNVMLPVANARRYAVGWILFLLAILSKETAVLGAPLLTICVFYFSKDRWNWRTYLKTLPFWILSLGYAGLRKTILNFDGDFSFYKQSNIYSESILNRIYTFFATLPKYLELLVYPHDLHIDRHFSVYVEPFFLPVILGFTMCVVAAIIVGRCVISKGRVWLFPTFLILWFASTHLLHSGVLLPLNSLFLEHWMYMPSMAFFMAVVAPLEKLFKRKSWRTFVISIVVVICCTLGTFTYVQNRIWSNSITLFTHILKFNPRVARVRHDLAMAYSDLGENAKALQLYEEALAEQPYPQTYHNMGILFINQNQIDKAEEHFLKAIQMDPQFHPSYPYLVNIYSMQGKKEKAAEYEARYYMLRSKQ